MNTNCQPVNQQNHNHPLPVESDEKVTMSSKRVVGAIIRTGRRSSFLNNYLVNLSF